MSIIKKRNVRFLEKAVIADGTGRLLISAITCKNKAITIANVYLPPEQPGRLEWLEDVTKFLLQYHPPQTPRAYSTDIDVIGGDWNLFEKPRLDRDGGIRYASRDTRDIIAMKNFLDCLRADGINLSDGLETNPPTPERLLAQQ